MAELCPRSGQQCLAEKVKQTTDRQTDRRRPAWVCHSQPVTCGLGHLPILGFLVLQIEDETQVSRATQGEQDNYEMHVRAANIVSH